jgi:TolB-like protein
VGCPWNWIADLIVDLRSLTTSRQTSTSNRQTVAVPRKRFQWGYLLPVALVLAVAGFFTWRTLSPSRSASSILILPLRPLSQDATNSLLGLGIADALITKIGQTGQLQVRPLSAIRKYAKEDNDPIETARQLDTETVLAGTLQQSGDRIRVNVQLLKTTTGETIWAQSFDVRSGDVFTVQDEIARRVANELNLKLDAGQRRDFEKRSTTNAQAFEFYSKSLYHLANRMRVGEIALAVELLKKAIELDPNYALARAQLGYAYALHGVFVMDDPALVELATKQLGEAEKVDPRIAQIHVARSVLLFSRHGQWNLREAILEGRAALRLDPNAGHPDLAYYYDHLGLEALAAKHRYAALRSDPDNEYYKTGIVGHYYGFMLADEGAAAEQKLFHRSPSVEYYLIKGMVNEAAPLVEKEFAGNPGQGAYARRILESRVRRAQLYALQEKFGAAAAEIAAVEIEAEKAPRSLPFHHLSYGIAQVRARMGDASRALHWLQITVDTGWPQYPMMARDHMLDPVRDDPMIAKFLASLKKTWENNMREFGNAQQQNL